MHATAFSRTWSAMLKYLACDKGWGGGDIFIDASRSTAFGLALPCTPPARALVHAARLPPPSPQLIHAAVLVGGDDAQPVAHVVLLQVLLGEVLQIAFAAVVQGGGR